MEASARCLFLSSLSSDLFSSGRPQLVFLSLQLSLSYLLLLLLPLSFSQQPLSRLLVKDCFKFLEGPEELHLHTLLHDHAFKALFRNLALRLERVVIAEQD